MAAVAEKAETDVAAAVAAPAEASAAAPADGATPAEDAEAAAAKAARQLQKKLKKEQQKKEQKEKKEKKAAAAAAASAKKKGQSNEGMDVGKEEDFPRWYNQVITKSELIEFYDISVRCRSGGGGGGCGSCRSKFRTDARRPPGRGQSRRCNQTVQAGGNPVLGWFGSGMQEQADGVDRAARTQATTGWYAPPMLLSVVVPSG